MAYIWNDYRKDKYYSIASSKASSYVEVWDSSTQYPSVNIHNRLTDVFYPEKLMSEVELNEIKQLYRENLRLQDFFNIVFHHLAQADRMRGITKEDVLMQLLRKDIEEGRYGVFIQENIGQLLDEHQYIIMKMLLQYQKDEEKRIVFDEVLHLIFGKVLIYKEQSSGKTYVYVEQLRTKYNELLFEIIKYLFMDMKLVMENYWANEHFGIIGVDTTMKIDRFTIV